jgi:hypothetical protein
MPHVDDDLTQQQYEHNINVELQLKRELDEPVSWDAATSMIHDKVERGLNDELYEFEHSKIANATRLLRLAVGSHDDGTCGFGATDYRRAVYGTCTWDGQLDGLNQTLASAVLKLVRQHPERHRQDTLILNGSPIFDVVRNGYTRVAEQTTTCGTAGCLVGWTLVAGGKMQWIDGPTMLVTARLLGVTCPLLVAWLDDHVYTQMASNEVAIRLWATFFNLDQRTGEVLQLQDAP